VARLLKHLGEPIADDLMETAIEKGATSAVGKGPDRQSKREPVG